MVYCSLVLIICLKIPGLNINLTVLHNHAQSVMNKYHKMDTNEYLNIFGCHIMYRKNIQIYSDATYLRNKYPSILVRRKKAWIFIRIIFKGYFIWIFKYSYSSLIEEMFEKGSIMLPLNKCYTGYFFMQKLYNFFFIKKGKYQNKVLSKYSNIFDLF